MKTLKSLLDGGCTSLSNSLPHLELWGLPSTYSYSCPSILMHTDCIALSYCVLTLYSLMQDCPQPVPVYSVVGLLQIYKCKKCYHIFLNDLLYDLPYSENLIYTPSTWSETPLLIHHDSISLFPQSITKNPCIHLTNHT